MIFRWCRHTPIFIVKNLQPFVSADGIVGGRLVCQRKPQWRRQRDVQSNDKKCQARNNVASQIYRLSWLWLWLGGHASRPCLGYVNLNHKYAANAKGEIQSSIYCSYIWFFEHSITDSCVSRLKNYRLNTPVTNYYSLLCMPQTILQKKKLMKCQYFNYFHIKTLKQN